MADILDFPKSSFSIMSLEVYGRQVGHQNYWKIFAIENTLRVAINSILSIQVGKNWWGITTVHVKIINRARNFRGKYEQNPGSTPPPTHDLYFVFLGDLAEIMRLNRHHFVSIIDVDDWIVKIENLIRPRNLVAHMNHIVTVDRKTIDLAHQDLKKLISQIKQRKLNLIYP